MTVDAFLALLEDVNGSSDGWSARCPSHDDERASLSIGLGADDRILVKCHAGAGCSMEAIVSALGVRPADLFPEAGGMNIAATYDYLDEEGALLFQVVRLEPKEFRQRRPDGADGWVWKTAGTRRVLYRLPQLLAAVAAGETVYVVEGEKDVHALEGAGIVATTSAMGAGKWRAEYATPLRGADVVVVQDRDEEGRKHAAAVVKSLDAVAASVRLVEPAEGKDAADHLEAGRSLDELVPVLLSADTQDVQPEVAEPDPDAPKGESAAAALVRYAKEYELVRHTTGVLFALRGDDDPIALEVLIGRLTRRYARTGKVASAEARKSVRKLLDDPEAPERDLAEQLEGMRARMSEKRAEWEAARVAELEAEREAELAEAREEAAPLLGETNLIRKFGEEIEDVVAGEDAVRAAKLLHLVLTSSQLDEKRVGSELIKGQSAVGKTFLAEVVLEFFPPASIVKANSMSPKSLFYRALGEGDTASDGEFVVDLSHSLLYLGEAATSAEVEFTVGIIRQLLSDGEVVHDTVIDGVYTRLVIRGPVSALITTTRAQLDHELETRFISDRLDESEEATRAVMRQIARVEAGVVSKPDMAPWRALHRFLELTGPHAVVNPMVDALAEKLPASAIRMRRDLTFLSLLTRANALLHFEQRTRDEHGRIEASLQDYAVVRDVLLDAFDYAIGLGVPEGVRKAVAALPAKGETGISYRALGDKLRINHETARARVWEAIVGGYAVNHSKNKQRAELTQGDPLPEEAEPALPTMEALAELIETTIEDTPCEPSPDIDPPLRHAAATPVNKPKTVAERLSATDSPLRHAADLRGGVADGGETAIRHGFPLNHARLRGSGGVADGTEGVPATGHGDGVPPIAVDEPFPALEGHVQTIAIGDGPELRVEHVPAEQLEQRERFAEFLTGAFERRAPLAVDLEATGKDPHAAGFTVRLWSVSDGQSAYVVDARDARACGLVSALLSRYPHELLVHNGYAYDLAVAVRELGVDVGLVSRRARALRLIDTTLLSRLVHPDAKRVGLKQMSARYFGDGAADPDRLRAKAFRSAKADWATIDVAHPAFVAYAASDAALTQRLHEQLRGEAGPDRLLEFEHRVAAICMRAGLRGFAVDDRAAGDLEARLVAEEQRLEQALAAQGIERVATDVGRASIVAALEREGLQLENGKLDRSVLAPLAAAGSVVAHDVLKFRTAAKFRALYAGMFARALEQDGRLHAYARSLAATTGRMAISGVPLQTMPKQTELGAELDEKSRLAVRDVLVADPGRVVGSVDFRAMELRLAAGLSGDGALRAVVEAGDPHLEVARALFGAEPSARQRDVAKTVNFAAMYGMQAHGLSVRLGISHGQAQSFLDSWWARFPQLQRFAAELGDDDRSPWGRRLPVDAPRHAKLNHRIQAAGRDIFCAGLLRLEDVGLVDHLALPLHDEYVLTVAEHDAHALVAQVAATVSNELRGVPLPVDENVGGRSWGSAK